jgi:hypothetical protein
LTTTRQARVTWRWRRQAFLARDVAAAGPTGGRSSSRDPRPHSPPSCAARGVAARANLHVAAMEPTATPFAFHQPFAWSTARLLQVRLRPVGALLAAAARGRAPRGTAACAALSLTVSFF